MNSVGKHIRTEAKVKKCGHIPCYTYRTNNSITPSLEMATITINIVGTDSTHKTLTLYSVTNALQIFTATWTIDADIFEDAPTSQTGWDAFKSSYVTDGNNDNIIDVDYNQWAYDNGTAVDSDHTFQVSCTGTDGTCLLEVNTLEKTITVVDGIQFYLKPPVFESTGDINSLAVGDVIMPNLPEWHNDNNRMIRFSTMEYRWYRDGVLISNNRYLQLNNSDANKVISYTVFAEDIDLNQLTNTTPVVVGTVGAAVDLVVNPHYGESRDVHIAWDGTESHNNLNKSFDTVTLSDQIFQNIDNSGMFKRQAESNGLNFVRSVDGYLSGKTATRIRHIQPIHDQISHSYYILMAFRYNSSSGTVQLLRNWAEAFGLSTYIDSDLGSLPLEGRVISPVGLGTVAVEDKIMVTEFNVHVTQVGTSEDALVNYRMRWASPDPSLNKNDLAAALASGTAVRGNSRPTFWNTGRLNLTRFGLDVGLSGDFPLETWYDTDLISFVINKNPLTGYSTSEVSPGVWQDDHQSEKDINFSKAFKDSLAVYNA